MIILLMLNRKDLGQVVITAEEIRGWKDLSMVAYEAAVWDSLGNKFCSPTDRRLVFLSVSSIWYFIDMNS